MIQIRHSLEDDFDQIFNLLVQLWPHKELNYDDMLKVYKRGLESYFQRYICAEDDTGIVGFCTLTAKNNFWQEGFLGHIDEIIVDKDYRGRGIGSMLLKRIIKAARELGCRRIELDGALDRSESHKFYEKEGFTNRAHLFSKKI